MLSDQIFQPDQVSSVDTKKGTARAAEVGPSSWQWGGLRPAESERQAMG